jgi:hypothetical protein
MTRTIASLCILLFAVATATAQTTKPWIEWSRKDAEKTLNDSAWAQTQTETDTSHMTYAPTVTPTTASRREDSRISEAGKTDAGANNSPISLKYRVRLLSAKPVRAAFARMVQLQQEKPNEALATQLEAFVNREFEDYIIVAVAVDSSDQKSSHAAMQSLTVATTESLKNIVYLERKDGKRLVLMDYRAPGPDGMGAKFVFQRKLEGNLFLTPESDTFRFVAEFNEKFKLAARYKVSAMTYEGRLEY